MVVRVEVVGFEFIREQPAKAIYDLRLMTDDLKKPPSDRHFALPIVNRKS